MESITVSMVEPRPVQVVPLSAGDVAFEHVYRVEYPGLVAVARALTGDTRDGEDLVQDTMVRAFIHWGRVSQLDRPGAWCHRVLVNACRSRLRRRRVERRFLQRARRDEPWISGPSDEAIAFWRVVREMPERPRMAVALYFAGERSAVEIAAILGCPAGTVYSDLSRARRVLADQLLR